MKRRSTYWLTLAEALLVVRDGARVALGLVPRLESLLAGQAEALAVLAAVELKLIGLANTARRALKAKKRPAADLAGRGSSEALAPGEGRTPRS